MWKKTRKEEIFTDDPINDPTDDRTNEPTDDPTDAPTDDPTNDDPVDVDLHRWFTRLPPAFVDLIDVDLTDDYERLNPTTNETTTLGVIS